MKISSSTSPIRSDHSAAYMVLLGRSESPKVLLFSADHRYLSEVFDDGFIVDNLRMGARRCDKPGRLSLAGVLPESAQLSEADVLCFALGPDA
jgi:hypothetical protein